jgi:hypothetical protein
MVLARRARLPDLAEHRVLVGGVGRGEVGERGKEGVALGAYGRLAVAELAAAGGELGQLLALLRRRGAAATPARAVLLGAQLLELGRQCAPALVELEQPINRLGQRLIAPAEGPLDRIRIVADQPDVENEAPPLGSSAAPTSRGASP